MLIVGYGAFGIVEEQLREGVEITLTYIKLVADGETEIVKIFSSKYK